VQYKASDVCRVGRRCNARSHGLRPGWLRAAASTVSHIRCPQGTAHRMLMLALARAENMVAATPLRLAICWPTAARIQHSLIFSTLLMRPALMASLNLRIRANEVRCSVTSARRPYVTETTNSKFHAP